MPPGLTILMLSFLSLFALGCEGELGERCDGFFQNTCRAPASCIELDDRAVCATGCSSWLGEESCDDPTWEMIQVSVDHAGGTAAMGCHCVPPAE